MGARSSQSRGPGLNKSDGHLLEYYRDAFGAGGGGTNFVPAGFQASGGNATNTYTAPDGNQYKAHIFTSSGSFVVDTADGGETVDYLIIAGGGGGGAWVGGGGGAGGVISSHPDYPAPKRSSSQPVSVAGGPYAVVIGGGGTGWHQTGEGPGNVSETGTPGVDSTVFSKRAAGGGMGGDWAVDQREQGGSGGGAGYPSANTGADGNQYAPTSPAFPGPAPNQGNPGGDANTPALSTGGGGGAGAAGQDASGTNSGDGGIGVQITIAGAPTYTGTGRGAQNPGPGEYMWYAGGGGGGHHNASPSTFGNGGIGGASNGAQAGGTALNATDNCGGGGGGSGGSGGGGHGGNGGSGIVIIRYQVG